MILDSTMFRLCSPSRLKGLGMSEIIPVANDPITTVELLPAANEAPPIGHAAAGRAPRAERAADQAGAAAVAGCLSRNDAGANDRPSTTFPVSRTISSITRRGEKGGRSPIWSSRFFYSSSAWQFLFHSINDQALAIANSNCSERSGCARCPAVYGRSAFVGHQQFSSVG